MPNAADRREGRYRTSSASRLIKVRAVNDNPRLGESPSSVQISQSGGYEVQHDSQRSECKGNVASGKSLQVNAVSCTATPTRLDIAQVLRT